MTGTALGGGCFCGRIRYEIARVPTDVGHCHCRMCQRIHGAGMVTWSTQPRADVSIEGEPTWFRSSDRARRAFCPACGTPLFWLADEGDDIDVTVASLDEPDRVTPTHNSRTATRRAWMHGFDRTLPDYAEEAPAPA